MNKRWIGSRYLWGGLILAAGIMFLLQNLGVIHFAGIIWSVMFVIAGIFVLSFFFADRNNWWALIPGIIFVDLALITALGALAPGFAESLGGAVFLAGIGLAFWLIYLFNRDFWWAIIPGGVMLTLAGVVIAGSMGYSLESGGIFFLGLGLTFVMVALMPAHQHDLRWAWIPALVLLVMGLGILGASANLLLYIVPVVLILLGLFLIYRTFTRRNLDS